MEKTIVQFILENIWVFLPLGATGILATLVLFFLPRPATPSKYEEGRPDYITIFSRRMNIYVVVYLIIWVTIILIGSLSDFLAPTLIGGIIAAVPLIILILLEYKTNKSKVS